MLASWELNDTQPATPPSILLMTEDEGRLHPI